MTTTIEKPAFYPARKFSQTLVAATVAACALMAMPATAQPSSAGAASGSSPGSAASGGTSSAGSSASGAPGITSSGTPRIGGSSAGGSMVARNDEKMMIDLAHDNIAEIEVGKMALEKSQNDGVKKFAQHMIDDHTTALKELQTLAQSKGATLPDDPGAKHKTMATAMKALSGAAFDKQYMKGAGVSDHQNNLQLLQKIQKDAKDPEFKAMAVKMQPTVRGHLKMAEQTAASTGK
jgi:putative membrane protein